MKVEQKAPLPLESLPALEKQDTGREWEKQQHWDQLLTGDPATVPLVFRQQAGAADESCPEEENQYKLMRNINRSWVVDHRQLNREQVRSSWPELRQDIAKSFGVRDSEPEVYTALSLQHKEKPLRDKIRKLYEDHYRAALSGETLPQPEDATSAALCADAQEQGQLTRERHLPLAEQLSKGWSAIQAFETKLFSLPEVVSGSPAMLQAVDELADMDETERARVYAVARSLASTRKLETRGEDLGEAMLHSVRRGVSDLGHSMVQGAGHLVTALTSAAADSTGIDTLRSASSAMDKRLQVLHEMRRVAQDEVFPVKLKEGSSFWEELAVDAAGAAPGAALAFMGGAGFGALTLGGAGAAVAEARSRAPEGRQELQTAAGIVGGAVQAGIYMGMSRIGAQMLNRTIASFSRAAHSGVKGYSLAALQGLGTLTAENAKLLLAGKMAHATELGMQELAARVDRVASNIDWERFGDNLTDIETNMREAAMNLPFILIAAGKASLHHFRNPADILDTGERLAEWGIDESTRRRIIDERDIHVQNDLLREALCGSRRWSGAGAAAIEEFLRSLSLLNTAETPVFRTPEEVRDFLNIPKRSEIPERPLVEHDTSDPEVVARLVERHSERKKKTLSSFQRMPYLLLMDEWYQKSQGELRSDPQDRTRRTGQYLALHDSPDKIIPSEVKLNGYYHPFRPELVRAVKNDVVQEIREISYQMLLNAESLDSMNRSYRNVDEARRRTENFRTSIVSELCAAVDRCARGMRIEKSFDHFCEAISELYIARRHNARCAPEWMQRTSPKTFRTFYQDGIRRINHPKKSADPKLQLLMYHMLGLRACGESLVKLLPHLDEFQDALSIGHRPHEAYQLALQNNFKDDLNTNVWNPAPVTEANRNNVDNRIRYLANKEAVLNYLALSGVRPESSPDGQGNELWRIKRPDGRYTPWLPTQPLSANALVGNVQTSFLPMGGNKLGANIRQAFKQSAGRWYFWRTHMYPELDNKFLGFDHLGNTASRDLCAQWLGDSTLFGVGLDFSSSTLGWNRYQGRWVDRYLKQQEGETDRYLVKYHQVMTPLRLSQLRFKAYWNRMLSSGWVTPDEVGESLVKLKALSRKKVDDILKMGVDRPYDISRISGPVRRAMKKAKHDFMHHGDPVRRNARLADHMARLNLVYMLSNLRDLPLPDSVKQWFYTSVFSNYKEEPGGSRLRGAVRKANRLAAEEVKKLLPSILELRKLARKEGGYPFEPLMREAVLPEQNTRLEQGWCFSYGGESGFRGKGQRFWNLLRDPARAWKLLAEDERASISDSLRDVLGGKSPESAMEELSELLQKYPQLREYSMESRDSDSLSRMVLNPLRTVNLAEPLYTVSDNTRLYRPLVVRKGYSMEKDVQLPAECQEDARVLPAIRLLAELRRSVASAPYADESGIWWENERYGGAHGRKPAGMEDYWQAEPVFAPLLTFYGRAYAMAQNYGAEGKLNVCGVPVGGLTPEDIDVSRLRNITIYRCSRLPEHMVRLMPGEVDSANPYQRAPYVVHSADGVPLFPNRMARNPHEFMQTLIPLTVFNSDMTRLYDYKSNKRFRQRQLRVYVDELLHDRALSPENWARADESRINNLELLMQMIQDSRLPYYLASRNPAEMTRGEALASELGRLMLLAECGTDREAGVENLVQFCEKLRNNPEDVELLHVVLDRVVSPEPKRLREAEQPRPEEDRELDLSPEDAEYY